MSRPSILPVSEADYQARIVDYAALRYWRLYAAVPCLRRDGRWRTSVTSKGFPDVVAVRGEVLAALEVKAQDGRPTPDQEVWVRALDEVRVVTARIVRPSDWPSVEQLLR